VAIARSLFSHGRRFHRSHGLPNLVVELAVIMLVLLGWRQFTEFRIVPPRKNQLPEKARLAAADA